MAYTTINKSTDYFNTLLYTATGTQSVTGAGFQPDMSWVKTRSAASSHYIADSVRGATKTISPNNTNQEGTQNLFTSFDSDGVSLGSDNWSDNRTAVIWNWKAGTTGSGTTTGSGYGKAYSYSVNTTAGFSIVKYTGNGTSGQQIPHHLGVVPKMIIQKRLPTDGAGWNVYHHSLGLNYLMLQSDNASASDSGKYNANPTSTYVQIGNDGGMNTNDAEHILYCFAEKTGYSKFGSYTGNGSTDNAFIYTGFKPTFFMTKRYSDTARWCMWDSVRDPDNSVEKLMYANENSAEGGTAYLDFYSNGVKILDGNSKWGADGSNYIYMAFGQSLVGSNNVPSTAR